MEYMRRDLEIDGFDCRVRLLGFYDDSEEVADEVTEISKDYLQTEWFCGYVKVPEGWEFNSSEIEVHGGISYCKLEPDGSNWLGFDCMHLHDDTVKCNFKFVIKEIKKIIKYLKEKNNK